MRKLYYNDFKDRIDVDAVERALGFDVLYAQNGNDVGHCLFPENHSHGDTTGKFAIHREKLVYHCWVCGGGSLLSLVMETQDLDVDQASEWLYPYATGEDHRSDLEFRDYLLEMLQDIEKRVETMPYFNARVLDRFDGPIDYFHLRGISDEVISGFKLCFGDVVLKPAPTKMIDGVIIKNEDDYYGPAAIFPHFWQDKLVGWQYRWMEHGVEDTPRWVQKYSNTTSFPKHNTIFNYDRALKTYKPFGAAVVVESVPTALMLESLEIPAVSHFGGVPSPEQLRLLRRFDKVILAPDNDGVGDEFLEKATVYLERFTSVYHTGKVICEPKADLGDYLFYHPDDWQDRVIDHLILKTHQAGVSL